MAIKMRAIMITRRLCPETKILIRFTTESQALLIIFGYIIMMLTEKLLNLAKIRFITL